MPCVFSLCDQLSSSLTRHISSLSQMAFPLLQRASRAVSSRPDSAFGASLCFTHPQVARRQLSNSSSSSSSRASNSSSSRVMAAATAFVVAVDGPAASGKGTIAKRIASELQLAHLDTGLLYRGVGWEAVSKGVDLADEQAVAAIAQALDLGALAANPALRGDDAAVAASKVSALPAVRAALLEAQRRFAAHPPADKRGAVLDGRDIGTVICPDAPIKLYVTADVAVRAQRRLDELISRLGADAPGVNFDAVLADMKARDDRDMNRATAPLKPAEDAVRLDTTQMSIDQAFEKAKSLVEAALAKQGQPVAA